MQNSRNPGRRRKRPQNNIPKKPVPELECPICNKNIRYLASAICIEADKTPAHFDCVLNKLQEDNELQEKERICYLGNGSFGIIKQVEGHGPQFFIRKRIQFEEPETHPEWRKDMQYL